jgi:hypothetical protein
MNNKVNLYIWCVIATGAAVLSGALATWSSPKILPFALYLLLAVLASLVKLRLPGMEGTYSLNFLFLLFGVLHFSLAETVIAGCVGALVQSVCNAKHRPSSMQILFNMANLTISVGVCFMAVRLAVFSGLGWYRPAEVALVACLYFVMNTVLVSGVLSLLQGKRLAEVCRQWYVWSFPYYLVGAALVGLIPSPDQPAYREAWLILLPLVYLVQFFLRLLKLGPLGHTNGTKAEVSLPKGARLYLLVVLAAGMTVLVAAALHWQPQQPLRFLSYLALAAAAATLKVRLPGMRGTISVSFVLVLVSIAELTLAEAIFISVIVGIVQCMWKPKRRPTTVQVLFNAACLSVSTAIAYTMCAWAASALLGHSLVGLLIAATFVHYTCNTIMVAIVLCLVEQKPLFALWQNCHFWSCPYYLVGTAAAGLMITTSRVAGWQTSLIILPLMVLVYVSYRVHVSQVDSAVWGS